MRMASVVSRSAIAKHPRFPAILEQYNATLNRDGKVNETRFFREHVATEMPETKYINWYQFVKRFRTENGLSKSIYHPDAVLVTGEGAKQLEVLAKTLKNNDQATRNGISNALNLGATFFEALWEKYSTAPETLTPFEHKVLSECLFKAMKAQDSRIQALGAIRQDSREQAKFEHAFQDSSMEE